MKKKQLRISHSVYPDGSRLDWPKVFDNKSRHLKNIFILLIFILVILLIQFINLI